MNDELIQDTIMNELNQQNSSSEQVPEKKQETAPEAAPKETSKEYNMRMMREKLEAAERRAQELESRELERQKQYQSPSPHLSPDLDEIAIGDEDLIEGKQLKKYVNATIKQYEKRLEELASQNAASSAESRLKQQYNDFDSVVNEENIKNFAALYPEEYKSVLSNPDIYAKGKTAYNMIKNFGLMQQGNHEDVDRRLSENKSKPRSAASLAPQTGDNPLTRVGDYDRRILTEERKEQIRRQVEQAKMYR